MTSFYGLRKDSRDRAHLAHLNNARYRDTTLGIALLVSRSRMGQASNQILEYVRDRYVWYKIMTVGVLR